jgi:hypothetical protein
MMMNSSNLINSNFNHKFNLSSYQKNGSLSIVNNGAGKVKIATLNNLNNNNSSINNNSSTNNNSILNSFGVPINLISNHSAIELHQQTSQV